MEAFISNRQMENALNQNQKIQIFFSIELKQYDDKLNSLKLCYKIGQFNYQAIARRLLEKIAGHFVLVWSSFRFGY